MSIRVMPFFMPCQAYSCCIHVIIVMHASLNCLFKLIVNLLKFIIKSYLVVSTIISLKMVDHVPRLGGATEDDSIEMVN